MENQSDFNWMPLVNLTIDSLAEMKDGNTTNFTDSELKRNWIEPIRDPLYIVIPISVMYVIIFVTGVIGNVSTCVVISRNKSMHTATNYYLFSLAVSDLLLLISGLPQEMYSIWYRYPYIFGEAFCVLRGLAAETSTNATVLTITAFTVERYIAICHPFISHTMSKLSRAVKLIFIIWFIALAFAIPQALQFGVVTHRDTTVCTQKIIIIEHSFEISTFLFFVTPMTLITLLYALIGFRLRNSNTMRRERSRNSVEVNRLGRSGTFTKHSGPRKVTSQSSRRILKMLVAVVVAFFICWAPFHVQRLVAIYGTVGIHTAISPLVGTIYVVTTYVSGILYYLSTTINPVLYHIMSVKFREAFKETFEANVQCKTQWGDRRKETEKHIPDLAKQQRETPFGIPRQERPDFSDNATREQVIYKEKQCCVAARDNRFTGRRNSRGSSDQVTSSSYTKSTSASISISHDTVLNPFKLSTHPCSETNNIIKETDEMSSVHIHYSVGNQVSGDICHISMETTGCCLETVVVRQKRTILGTLWNTIKCLPKLEEIFDPSPTHVINCLTEKVENKTQTDLSDFKKHNKESSYKTDTDELTSYMEEVQRRLQC